ncbi:MAG: TonB family protein [Alphaproteobacteria bacterium]|nr:TonB family protein [Alphaproteobacteria bacterium]
MRLVSFAASAALAAVVLLALASLRYAPLWRQDDAPHIFMVSEMVREPAALPTQQTPPPRQQPRSTEPQTDTLPAPAPSPPVEPVVITSPTWVERPRNPERYYPRDAFMRGVAGEVVLDCDVDVVGRLSCIVTSETPAGQGFGDAALRIAGAHVMRPAMQDGTPVRGRYRMVVPFSPSG